LRQIFKNVSDWMAPNQAVPWRLQHLVAAHLAGWPGRKPFRGAENPPIAFVGEQAKQVRGGLVLLGEGQPAISNRARAALDISNPNATELRSSAGEKIGSWAGRRRPSSPRKRGWNGFQIGCPYSGSRFPDCAACTVAIHATYPKSGCAAVLGAGFRFSAKKAGMTARARYPHQRACYSHEELLGR
jgi:hypothetical protein